MKLFLIILIALVSGCTSIGPHNPEVLQTMQSVASFGPPQTVRLCALLDEGVTKEDAVQLVEEGWNKTESHMFGLRFEIVKATPWRRKSFMYEGIVEDIRKVPLSSGCDRVFAFVNRSAGDILYGLASLVVPLPEVYGASLLTHGFVVAKFGSLMQVLAWPTKITKHELYHVLGCGHDDMEECYKRIAYLKRIKQEQEFFPVLANTENEEDEVHGGPYIIKSRAQINEINMAISDRTGPPIKKDGTVYTDDEAVIDLVFFAVKLQSIAENATKDGSQYRLRIHVNRGKASNHMLGAVTLLVNEKVVAVSYIYDKGAREEVFESYQGI